MEIRFCEAVSQPLPKNSDTRKEIVMCGRIRIGYVLSFGDTVPGVRFLGYDHELQPLSMEFFSKEDLVAYLQVSG